MNLHSNVSIFLGILVEIYKFWSIIPNDFSNFSKTIYFNQHKSFIWPTYIKLQLQEELLPASIMIVNTFLGDHAFFKIQNCFPGVFQQWQVADICVLLKLAFSNSYLLLFLLKQK